VTKDEKLRDQDAVEAKALWDDVDLNQRTPPSPLRDGKTVGQWYARILLQDASLYIDLELEQAAERDFLMLLTMDEANHSLAAFGFARLLHMRHSFPEVIRTLQNHARESDEDAWRAYQLLGNTCLRESRWEEAISALETAIRIAPAEAAEPRETMERGAAFAREQLDGRAS
jgi:tetratricopeptide (TPR) repeat protein